MNVQKVYNVVCLLINSIVSKIFKLKVQRMHQTKWDRICSEKQQPKKRIFLPYLNMSKKSEKISKHRFSHFFSVGVTLVVIYK